MGGGEVADDAHLGSPSTKVPVVVCVGGELANSLRRTAYEDLLYKLTDGSHDIVTMVKVLNHHSTYHHQNLFLRCFLLGCGFGSGRIEAARLNPKRYRGLL